VLLLQFDSTVSGRQHPRSDVDLAVLLQSPSPSLGTLSELSSDLQPFYPGREIDLGVINRADPFFLKKITEDCRLLYGSPRRLHELKMYAFRRYQDHRRYLALERPYVDRALRTLAPP
jgi:predicted nucleotidyltransferase